SPPEPLRNAPLASRLAGTASHRRVVWLIFDELDYRLSFPERPRDVAMPEFDRLQAESIWAAQAFSPPDDTVSSLPSLVSGKELSADADGPASLALYGKDAPTAHLTPQMTIFAEVRALGGNSAVAGWYLPYCRLFPGVLSECTFYG